MRLCEFETSSRRELGVLFLFAWAKYKRGEIPTEGEYDYVSKRVLANYPTAEFVKMKRTCVPAKEGEETRFVWWEFTWAVFGGKRRT